MRARSSCLDSACAEAPHRHDGLGGPQVVRHDTRAAPACSYDVTASNTSHLAGRERLRCRRCSQRRERPPAMGGQGWCRRLLVARAGHAHGDVNSSVGLRLARARRCAASTRAGQCFGARPFGAPGSRAGQREKKWSRRLKRVSGYRLRPWSASEFHNVHICTVMIL